MKPIFTTLIILAVVIVAISSLFIGDDINYNYSSDNITANITNTIYNNITNNITTNITNNIVTNITTNITNNITNNITTQLTPNTQSFYGTQFIFDELCNTNTLYWLVGALSSGTSGTTTTYAHPCQRTLLSSTTASSGYYINIGTTSLLLNNSMMFETVFNKATVTGNITSAYIGYIDSVSTALPTDGVYFNVSNVSVYATVRLNNVQTQSPNVINITTATWYKYRIEILNTTQATFTLFSSVTDTGAGTPAQLWTYTLNTTLPYLVGREVGAGITAFKVGGTTAQTIGAIDYLYLSNNIEYIR